MNDEQIKAECYRNNMISPFVDHLVSKDVVSYGLSSFGYDIRAGYTWKLFTAFHPSPQVPTKEEFIDPKNFNEKNVVTLTQHVAGEPIIIPPNNYALTSSMETLYIPEDVMCICLGKSTYARSGLILNVTPLEPGWAGQITIEVANATSRPILVYPGEGILQILFFRGDKPKTTYKNRSGKYQGQTGVTLPKVL